MDKKAINKFIKNYKMSKTLQCLEFKAIGKIKENDVIIIINHRYCKKSKAGDYADGIAMNNANNNNKLYITVDL